VEHTADLNPLCRSSCLQWPEYERWMRPLLRAASSAVAARLVLADGSRVTERIPRTWQAVRIEVRSDSGTFLLVRDYSDASMWYLHPDDEDDVSFIQKVFPACSWRAPFFMTPPEVGIVPVAMVVPGGKRLLQPREYVTLRVSEFYNPDHHPQPVTLQQIFTSYTRARYERDALGIEETSVAASADTDDVLVLLWYAFKRLAAKGMLVTFRGEWSQRIPEQLLRGSLVDADGVAVDFGSGLETHMTWHPSGWLCQLRLQ